MRLLAMGLVLVALVVAVALLFHRVNQLENELEQAKKPRFERLAGGTAEIPKSVTQAP